MSDVSPEQEKPPTYAEAKRIASALQTSGTELRFHLKDYKNNMGRVHRMFGQLAGETVLMSGRVVQVRYVVDGHSLFQSRDAFVRGEYIDKQWRPGPFVIDAIPESPERNAVIARPVEWGPEEAVRPDLLIAYEGLQIYGTTREMQAAQRRYDRINPNVARQ